MVYQKETKRHCTCQTIISWEISQQFHNQKGQNEANIALLVRALCLLIPVLYLVQSQGGESTTKLMKCFRYIHPLSVF